MRMDVEISIVRSNRKTVSIQVNPDLTITVRAPKRASKKEIDQILQKKEEWIQKHLAKMQIRQEQLQREEIAYLTEEEIKALAGEACKVIPKRVQYFAELVGVDYGRITIRNQRTRWGSCSSRGNLNFNCLLMLTPAEVLDYVVVHELCHRKEMNHSKAFWREVQKVIPDYKRHEKWLKDEGSLIMRRQRGKKS